MGAALSRYYAGRMRTEEGIERHRLAVRRNSVARNPRRVFGASGYLGAAPTPEQAAQLNQMARDFRAQQKGAA